MRFACDITAAILAVTAVSIELIPGQQLPQLKYNQATYYLEAHIWSAIRD